MSYQSPDASKELKRGNIASFFKPGSTKKAAKSPTGATTKSVLSPKQKTADLDTAKAATSPIKVEQKAGQQEPAASVRFQEANMTLPAQKGDGTGQVDEDTAQLPDMMQQQAASVKVENDAQNAAAGGEAAPKTEDDILNTDDAGGIGKRTSPLLSYAVVHLYVSGCMAQVAHYLHVLSIIDDDDIC